MIRLLKQWLNEQKGVAYIEFALCAPILLLLLGGAIDVTRMVLLHQKVEKAVFTVGDLVTRLQTETDVCTNIKNLETSVVRDMIKPFNWEEESFQFVMTSVIGARQGGDPGNAVEDLMEWRYNQKVTSLIGPFSGAYVSPATLPKTLKGLDTNERLIVTEMVYTFRPILPLLSGLETGSFHKISYLPVRFVSGNIKAKSGALSRMDGTC